MNTNDMKVKVMVYAITESMKDTITLNELKALKSLLSSREMQPWKNEHIGRGVKDPISMFDHILKHLAHMWTFCTHPKFFYNDPRMVVENSFYLDYPEVVKVIDFLVPLYEKSLKKLPSDWKNGVSLSI